MIRKLWCLTGALWILVILVTGIDLGGTELPDVHRVTLALAATTLGVAMTCQVMVARVVPRVVATERIWELGFESGAREERARLRANPVVVPMRRHCPPDCECRGAALDPASSLN